MAGEPAASEHSSTGSSVSGKTDESKLRLQRNLKILIGGMTALILVGLGAIAARIATMPDSEPPQALTTPSPVPGRELLPSRISLPNSSKIDHLALDGDRLAISYSGPDGRSIMIVDFAQDVVLKTLKIEQASTANPPER